jgi:ribulose-5-phosphate 4-epimerase/fuculose-1-phosphate aldolase
MASSIPLIKPFKDQEFLDMVKKISGKIEALNAGRFFDNCSTRYTSLFPFARINVKSTIGAYVSPGDIDKNEIRCEDMILANMPIGAGVYPFDYIGQKKPSVDTSIHLTTYKQYPHINYIIHGHAYIRDAKHTREYYPCGDLREAEEISYFISGKSVSYFNLKNHGFIILANAVDDIDRLDITFTSKQIGELVS